MILVGWFICNEQCCTWIIRLVDIEIDVCVCAIRCDLMFCCNDIVLDFDFGFLIDASELLCSCFVCADDIGWCRVWCVWWCVGCDIFLYLFLCYFYVYLIFGVIWILCFFAGLWGMVCWLFWFFVYRVSVRSVRGVWMNHIGSILADLSVLSV